jgi:hypothetical protein
VALHWLLSKVKDSYIALIGQIIGATWQTAILGVDGWPASATGATQIILHNYDYALRTGIGVFEGPATWLRPASEATGVAPALRDVCMRILIDRFTTMLEEVAVRYAGRVVLVDSWDTLGPADEANELSPTWHGFKKIAMRWRPVVNAEGLRDERRHTSFGWHRGRRAGSEDPDQYLIDDAARAARQHATLFGNTDGDTVIDPDHGLAGGLRAQVSDRGRWRFPTAASAATFCLAVLRELAKPSACALAGLPPQLQAASARVGGLQTQLFVAGSGVDLSCFVGLLREAVLAYKRLINGIGLG